MSSNPSGKFYTIGRRGCDTSGIVDHDELHIPPRTLVSIYILLEIATDKSIPEIDIGAVG